MTTKPSKPQVKPYLSVIPGRRPEQKGHTNIGQAKNAVAQSPKWRSAGYEGQRGKYLYEEIDGLQTGRKKYVQRICGGEIWEWDATTSDWRLLYNIPENSWEDSLPWRAKEYEFFVEEK